MQYLKLVTISALALAGLAFSFVAAEPVFAADPAHEKAVCEGAGGTYSGGQCTAPGASVTATIRNVNNLLIFIIGVIAVIMIIVGAIRYATSGGDQAQVTAAKNTILYAIIGLVVAFMAWGIASFVAGMLA